MKLNTQHLRGRKFAVIMIGLPASGKSTWIAHESLRADFVPFTVISSDNVLERIASEKGLTYSEVFKDYIGQATAEMKSTFKNAIVAGENIIWDQTNMSKKKRRGILSQIPDDYYKIAVDFSVLPVELKRRLDERAELTGKYIPWKVIEDMGKNYQAPSKDEGFDEIIKVKF